jgi:hypothetical protein
VTPTPDVSWISFNTRSRVATAAALLRRSPKRIISSRPDSVAIQSTLQHAQQGRPCCDSVEQLLAQERQIPSSTHAAGSPLLRLSPLDHHRRASTRAAPLLRAEVRRDAAPRSGRFNTRSRVTLAATWHHQRTIRAVHAGPAHLVTSTRAEMDRPCCETSRVPRRITCRRRRDIET